MPLVDRSDSRELADLWVELLYQISSSTSTVRRGGLCRMLRMASGLMKMEMSIRIKVITLAYFPDGRDRSGAHYDEEKAKRCHSLL
jgi:hypothetical protein